MVTAIVFVKAEVAKIPEVAEAIAALTGVSEVYSVTGAIDLIVIVRVSSHEQVAEVVADRLNKVAGVLEHGDPHRLPRVLAARSRGRVLARWLTADGSRTGLSWAVWHWRSSCCWRRSPWPW